MHLATQMTIKDEDIAINFKIYLLNSHCMYICVDFKMNTKYFKLFFFLHSAANTENHNNY